MARGREEVGSACRALKVCRHDGSGLFSHPHAGIDAWNNVGRMRDTENPLPGGSRRAPGGIRVVPGEQGWSHKAKSMVLQG